MGKREEILRLGLLLRLTTLPDCMHAPYCILLTFNHRAEDPRCSIPLVVCPCPYSCPHTHTHTSPYITIWLRREGGVFSKVHRLAADEQGTRQIRRLGRIRKGRGAESLATTLILTCVTVHPYIHSYTLRGQSRQSPVVVLLVGGRAEAATVSQGVVVQRGNRAS